MKKILLINMFSIILIFSCSTKAQEIDFAPLGLGNVWVYEHFSGVRLRGQVIDTSFYIDTIKYFGLAEGYFGNDRALRITEDNYFVMKEDTTFPEPLDERKYYKKNAELGDSWEVLFSGGISAIYTVTDTFPAYTFDTLVTGKMLNENFGLVEWDYVWTEEFGKLSALNWLGEVQYYLRGCVINGKAYGDTTFITVSVEDGFEPPDLIYLEQNYPNPFNSSTVINFSLPEEKKVVLELYNVLGQKMKVLLNRFMNSGKHSFQLNAEGLPSGTYFYVLRTPGLTETKKMLLLR
jgi:hypothetical protein